MKKLVLMQGAPGSGKSTEANYTSDKYYYQDGISVRLRSTDNLFMIEKHTNDLGSFSEYAWTGELVEYSHSINQHLVDFDMKLGIDVVIVDNTNMSQKNAQPYIDMAHEYGYEIEVIRCDPGIEVCKARNAARLPESKRVPEEVIDMMYSRMVELDISPIFRHLVS